jgi:hypothetical protein
MQFCRDQPELSVGKVYSNADVLRYVSAWWLAFQLVYRLHVSRGVMQRDDFMTQI